jgi:hypothetical protein
MIASKGIKRVKCYLPTAPSEYSYMVFVDTGACKIEVNLEEHR